MDDKTIDFIVDLLDDALLDGDFQFVDGFLNRFQVKQQEMELEDVDLLLTILVVTLPAKSKLENRAAFYTAVSKCLDKDLLVGLE